MGKFNAHNRDFRMRYIWMPMQNRGRRAFDYSLLLVILMILLACICNISNAVPVLRQQLSGFNCRPMHELPCEQVSINLASKPGEFGVLDYDFRTKKLEVHVSKHMRPSIFRDKDAQFTVERASSQYSFNEALKRLAKGERDPTVWIAKELDDKGEVKSTDHFSMGTEIGYVPLVRSKRFAVTIDHEQVYVVDLALERKVAKTFSFPCDQKEFLGRDQIGNSRFGRARKVGVARELDLFEVTSEGAVFKVKSWPVGSKPAFVPLGTHGDFHESSWVHNFRNKVYSLSASTNEIEVRTENGELISSLSVPGLDLATGNWDWHRNFICWEAKKGELSYFDIEKKVALDLPASVVADSFYKTAASVGNNDLMLLPAYIDSTTLVPQLLIASRWTGQIVKKWPQLPNRIYTLIEDGDQSLLLESGYEWGLSLVKRRISDGTVIDAHYPLRQWIVWIGLAATATIAWAIAWLFYSARNGGIAWIDIALVSSVLVGIAVWRLYFSGQPYASSRLPYEYGGGIFAGLMAVVCMQVACAKKSILNTATPICIVIAVGHLLVANLLNDRIYNRSTRGLTWADYGTSHTAISIVATMTSMSFVACFILASIGYKLQSDSKLDEESQGKSFQFSIREFLWLIFLVALVSQPLSISRWSLRDFCEVPWPDLLACSAMATLAITLSLALALPKNKIANGVGWVTSIAVIAALLSEFSIDFALGQPILLPAWRVGRAVLAATATTFVFASRLRQCQM